LVKGTAPKIAALAGAVANVDHNFVDHISLD
jgi:hypothetical protein